MSAAAFRLLRFHPQRSTPTQTREEKALLRAFRRLSAVDRALVYDAMRALLERSQRQAGDRQGAR